MGLKSVLFPGREERVRCWAVTRQRGMAHFILLRGVLAWGVPMLVVTSLGAWAVPPHLRPDVSLIVGLPVWLAGGAVFGWAVWRIREAEFRADRPGSSAGS